MAPRSGTAQMLFMVGLDEGLVDSVVRLRDAAVEVHDGDVVPAV